MLKSAMESAFTSASTWAVLLGTLTSWPLVLTVRRLFESVMVPRWKLAAAFTLSCMMLVAVALMAALLLPRESRMRRVLPLLTTLVFRSLTPMPSTTVGSPSSVRPSLSCKSV